LNPELKSPEPESPFRALQFFHVDQSDDFRDKYLPLKPQHPEDSNLHRINSRALPGHRVSYWLKP
jgi:hypothetical protein